MLAMCSRRRVLLTCMLCPGTVSYCAPELLKEGKLTKAADVYSFAMIMWEMYSGTALFRGMNSSQVGFQSAGCSELCGSKRCRYT